MNTGLIVLSIAQGLAFIGVLVNFSYRAGRLLEKVDNHEDRIDGLEGWRDKARRSTDTGGVPNA